jgi:hypothetical protein
MNKELRKTLTTDTEIYVSYTQFKNLIILWVFNVKVSEVSIQRFRSSKRIRSLKVYIRNDKI